jgi:hypothetical protein
MFRILIIGKVSCPGTGHSWLSNQWASQNAGGHRRFSDAGGVAAGHDAVRGAHPVEQVLRKLRVLPHRACASFEKRRARPGSLALWPAGFLFGEVGAAVARVRKVAVPAGGRAEDQLHPARVAGADRALDQLAPHGDWFSAHRTDEGRGRRHVTLTYRKPRPRCYKIAPTCVSRVT